MTTRGPYHRSSWPLGRCRVCGSLTTDGSRRCEIHQPPAWGRALWLIALAGGLLLALYLTSERFW